MSGYRLILLTGLLLSVAPAGATPAPEPGMNAGEWSPAVEGVRGRLLISEGKPFNGTGTLLVYLELRNVTDVANPIEIYYDPGRGVEGTLSDATGAPQPTAGMPASIMTPPPYWLSLPYDGDLWFRVSVTGYGVPRGQRAILALPGAAWVIPGGDKGHYFLTGRFRVDPPQGAGRPRAWKGTLDLPKVELPGAGG